MPEPGSYQCPGEQPRACRYDDRAATGILDDREFFLDTRAKERDRIFRADLLTFQANDTLGVNGTVGIVTDRAGGTFTNAAPALRAGVPHFASHQGPAGKERQDRSRRAQVPAPEPRLKQRGQNNPRKEHDHEEVRREDFLRNLKVSEIVKSQG